MNMMKINNNNNNYMINNKINNKINFIKYNKIHNKEMMINMIYLNLEVMVILYY